MTVLPPSPPSQLVIKTSNLPLSRRFFQLSLRQPETGAITVLLLKLPWHDQLVGSVASVPLTRVSSAAGPERVSWNRRDVTTFSSHMRSIIEPTRCFTTNPSSGSTWHLSPCSLSSRNLFHGCGERQNRYGAGIKTWEMCSTFALSRR
jgi:hypothetical protein